MLYMPSSGEGYGGMVGASKGNVPRVELSRCYMFIPPQTWIV